MIQHSNTKLPIDSEVFNNINTQEKAYWLGFLWADGHLRDYIVRVELSNKDLNHLKLLAKFFNFPIDNIRYRKDRNTNWISFSDKNIATRLREMEFKTENFYKYIPDELLVSFIRGFFDGDGSIFWTGRQRYKNTTSFGTGLIGTKPILEKVKEYLPDVYTKLRQVSSSKQMFRLETFSIKNSTVVCKYLYDDSEIHLLRKYEKCKDCIELNEGTSTIKLEPSAKTDDDMISSPAKAES